MEDGAEEEGSQSVNNEDWHRNQLRGGHYWPDLTSAIHNSEILGIGTRNTYNS